MVSPVSIASRQYDLSVPLEGNSIANDPLQFNTAQEIYRRLYALYPACLHYSVSDTQIVHYPYDVKMKNDKYYNGYWKELWNINACGVTVQVPVSFYIKKGVTTFHIDDTLTF